MALKSVYLPSPHLSSGIIPITEDEHRHLVVARAEPGELVEVFDGAGRVWTCEVVEVGKRQTTVRIQNERAVSPTSAELILGLALIRASAFELALEKVVEVGVTRIVPFVASRSNAKAERHDRWQRIIVETAKQAKRFYLPVLDAPMKFDQLLRLNAPTKILLTEREGNSLKPALKGAPVLFLVGPEGGWTDEELKSAEETGFTLVSMGSGILRSETAAIVGAALIRHELGING